MDQILLCKYSRPMIIMYDCGNTFLGHVFVNKYGTNYKCENKANPESN